MPLPVYSSTFTIDKMPRRGILLRQNSTVSSATSEVMKSLTLKNDKESALIQIFLAEFLGCACLMYFGCIGEFGSTSEVVKAPPAQGRLLFGFVVAALVQAIGHISDAHLSPAVTLCALLLGKINVLTAFIYVLAECIGCIFGFWLLQITTKPIFTAYMTSSTCGFCTTTLQPNISIINGFAIEFFTTGFLIYVVCSVWDSRNAQNTDSTALKFGILVAGLSIGVGPFTGCSMNPARTLAPAIINNVWKDHWLYWVAPLSGSLCTTLFYKYCFMRPEQSSEKSTDVTLNSPESPMPISKLTLNKSKNQSIA